MEGKTLNAVACNFIKNTLRGAIQNVNQVIQFCARTVRVGPESIRLAYLILWSWMEDVSIHLMLKNVHGKLPFLKLYINFKQFRAKRPLIGSNSNCLNNSSVWAFYALMEIKELFWIFMNRWHSNPHAKIPYVKRGWTILQYSVRNIYSGKKYFQFVKFTCEFFNLLATICVLPYFEKTI